MEEFLSSQFQSFSWPILIGVIVATIALLGKSADVVVKEAVALSERSGVPKVVIGATVISIGTTTPEAAVSVLAALQGSPDLALGNAVGSIICDTGLILGLACLVAPLPLPPRIVQRQGWIQLAAGVLLVAAAWPQQSHWTAFTEGGTGRLSQLMGFVFLALLVVYLVQSVRWSKSRDQDGLTEDLESDVDKATSLVIAKLILALIAIIFCSKLLIPALSEAALRLSVPQAVIAATILAFGTSVPELVTALTAARHGHGDLAVGNVVGADILNVLFVAGAAAAVTPGGLVVSEDFYRILFPAMLAVLVIFRVGIIFSKDQLLWPFGLVLLLTYAVTIGISCSSLAARSIL